MKQPKILRVGHKGAHAIHPGNTLESFDAALATGVDMIEFDVLPIEPARPHSELVLAHDPSDLDTTIPVRLDEALAHLAQPRFEGVGFDVDLKIPGYERRVADALADHGLVGRSLVSSQYERSLEAIRNASPDIRVGWSVPQASRDWTRNPLTFVPAMGMVAWLRAVLPARAAQRLRAGLIDGVMAHWIFATPRMLEAVREAGGELYVWTVDDLDRMQGLIDLGVDGIITNDPRLFHRALVPA